MNPQALSAIANQHLSEMHREAAADRLARRYRRARAAEGRPSPLRRLIGRPRAAEPATQTVTQTVTKAATKVRPEPQARPVCTPGQ